MKIAVVGSRTFNDYKLLKEILDFETGYTDFYGEYFTDKEPILIISGGAKGADSLAEKYASKGNREIKIFPAEWEKYGMKAGFIRNKLIVEYCDFVVAFWDGKSKGTADTINQAKKLKKNTYIYYF